MFQSGGRRGRAGGRVNAYSRSPELEPRQLRQLRTAPPYKREHSKIQTTAAL